MFKQTVFCDDDVATFKIDYADGTPFFHHTLKKKFSPSVAKCLYEKLAQLQLFLKDEGHRVLYTYIKEEDQLMHKYATAYGWNRTTIKADGYVVYAISTEI